MESRPTRRTLAKLLLVAPASLSLANLACKTAGPARTPEPTDRARSEKEKQELEKAITQLRKALDGLNKMTIPTGSEPGFVFSPTLPEK